MHNTTDGGGGGGGGWRLQSTGVPPPVVGIGGGNNKSFQYSYQSVERGAADGENFHASGNNDSFVPSSAISVS